MCTPLHQGVELEKNQDQPEIHPHKIHSMDQEIRDHDNMRGTWRHNGSQFRLGHKCSIVPATLRGDRSDAASPPLKVLVTLEAIGHQIRAPVPDEPIEKLPSILLSVELIVNLSLILLALLAVELTQS